MDNHIENRGLPPRALQNICGAFMEGAARGLILSSSFAFGVSFAYHFPGILLRVTPFGMVAEKIVQLFPFLLVKLIQVVIFFYFCTRVTIYSILIIDRLIIKGSGGKYDLRLTSMVSTIKRLLFTYT